MAEEAFFLKSAPANSRHPRSARLVSSDASSFRTLAHFYLSVYLLHPSYAVIANFTKMLAFTSVISVSTLKYSNIMKSEIAV